MKTLAILGFFIFLILITIFINLPTDLWVTETSLKNNSSELRYQRVVALAPSMSETMVALDQGFRLVGVTIHCQSEGLATVSKIGSFAEPNFEAIIAQKPDLVLAVPHVMAKPVLEKLVANKIEVFAHQPDTIADIKFINFALARKLGNEAKGVLLNEKIDFAIKKAQTLFSQFDSADTTKTALIAVSHMPFVVAGKSTFPSEIIEALGFKNLASDKKAMWPVWPLENLISNPPQFLIIASGDENLRVYEKLFDSLGLNLVQKKTQLIVPKKPIFVSPSPNIIDDVSSLAQMFDEDAQDEALF